LNLAFVAMLEQKIAGFHALEGRMEGLLRGYLAACVSNTSNGYWTLLGQLDRVALGKLLLDKDVPGPSEVKRGVDVVKGMLQGAEGTEVKVAVLSEVISGVGLDVLKVLAGCLKRKD